MRASEFTEDPAGTLQTLAQRFHQGFNQTAGNLAGRVVDQFNQDTITRIQSIADIIWPQLKQAYITETTAQIQQGRGTDKSLDRLQSILDRVRVRVQTNTSHGTVAYLKEMIIHIDPKQTQNLDGAGIAWTMGHELGHILHYHWFKTWQADVTRDPTAGERFADQLATWAAKRLGYKSAQVFNRMLKPETYNRSNQPNAPTSDRGHPSVYQRRHAAQQSGFDLSRGRKVDPTVPTA